jgi:predicted metal-dependent peptidase
MNPEVAKQITIGRTSLILDQPFFGELVCRLNMKETSDVPTLGVDGRNIFYNPDFVATLSPALTMSALAHETMHCVFDHIGRRNGRNPKKWNCAGDFVINLVLRDAGFEIGKTWLLDDKYIGMSADQVYNLLPDNDESEPLDAIFDGDGNGNVESIAAEWKIATIQAVNAAKKSGHLPQTMERFLDDLVRPRVDWREALRRFVTQISRNDYTWSRPNRRFLSSGIYLPSLYSEVMGCLANGIDTSGSITQDILNVWGAEITSAWDTAKPEKMYNTIATPK